jgi:hypothetical protein
MVERQHTVLRALCTEHDAIRIARFNRMENGSVTPQLFDAAVNQPRCADGLGKQSFTKWSFKLSHNRQYSIANLCAYCAITRLHLHWLARLGPD